MEEIKDIEEDELNSWGNSSLRFYVIQVLNGEETLEQFKENLLSFRNSEFYTGNNEKYKTIIDED